MNGVALISRGHLVVLLLMWLLLKERLLLERWLKLLLLKRGDGYLILLSVDIRVRLPIRRRQVLVVGLGLSLWHM